MRPSHDRRFLFVRMPGNVAHLQRIDTQAASPIRTVWSIPDGEDPELVSDVAADDSNRVYTAGANVDIGSYVEQVDPNVTPVLDPTTNQLTVTVKRWIDTNGPGQCQSISRPPDGADPTNSFVCNAGIDVHPSKQNLIYFSEMFGDANGFIAELNVDPKAIKGYDASGRPLFPVRRWSLATLSLMTGDNISGPRTLKIDRSGKVWVNTSSGHLVSLDPNTNRMTKHKVPDFNNDLWGIAPDSDVVGYTAAQTNKVAMLFPRFTPVQVPPQQDSLPQVTEPAIVTNEPAPIVTGTAPGDAKVFAAQVVRNPNEGTFVEAFVDQVLCSSNPAALPSLMPLGITANWGKAEGTFFYAVGFTGDLNSIARRIGHIRLPNKERDKFPRDDDDTDDGFNAAQCPGFHLTEPGDNDADGVPDQFDTATSKDNMTGYDPAALTQTTPASYTVATTATSLALIASVQADNPLGTIAADVYNAAGVLVATSGPMAGLAAVTLPTPGAGTFTVKVRNLGASSVNITPTFVVREPLVQ
jgi:hypothetical protein